MPICVGPVRVSCVIDGDTAWVEGEKIRISGIDAPEIEGRCGFERELAERAKRRLSELLSSQPFTVARSGTDRYGRTLATLYLRDSGDVGAVMTREGLVREWTGRRLPWC
ncbi:MAG: nuclease [Proteobacteria bacterium]|nr:MAG: nuclease [Pseudomonadota bacterium]